MVIGPESKSFSFLLNFLPINFAPDSVFRVHDEFVIIVQGFNSAGALGAVSATLLLSNLEPCNIIRAESAQNEMQWMHGYFITFCQYHPCIVGIAKEAHFESWKRTQLLSELFLSALKPLASI